ncbi:MAG: hypothetical protein OXU73_00970 [Candidatus Campbellbacteria bacterium]|nr:hypothetical protein [Candidatus Campbellbacteria bacterium]
MKPTKHRQTDIAKVGDRLSGDSFTRHRSGDSFTRRRSVGSFTSAFTSTLTTTFTTAFLIALLLALLLTHSHIALANNEVPPHIRSALENSDTHTEGDGITKWERKINGDIVKHFPNGKVNVVYKQNGQVVFYDEKGTKVATVEGKGITYFESDGKTIGTFADEDRIIEYEDGELKTIKSRRGENEGETTARKLSDTEFVLLVEGQNIFIGTNGNDKVNSFRVVGFGRDYSYDGAGDIVKEEATKDGELVWYALDSKKEEGSLWNSFMVFLIKKFVSCGTLEKAQTCYNEALGL